MNLFSKIKENPLLSFLIALLIFLVGVFVVILFCKSFEASVLKFLGLAEDKKHEALKFLGIAKGGVLLVLQVLMSHKRAKAMEDTASHTEQGLRQERLKNAIEHLGHDSDSVRLGGAYELYHLAEDNEDLRKTAFDILCAHIRQMTGTNEYRKAHKSKPSEEVQSLLTLLFVQEHEVFKGCDINLQGSRLNGSDLVKARLEKAVLTRVHLQGATLVEARLQGAILTGGHLQKANLERARLQGANLGKACLQGANLGKAQLQKATLEKAGLKGATLDEAHLQRAVLRGAHLQDAWLRRARLQGAKLDSAHLQDADLSEAHLQGTLLNEAYLQCAVLRGAGLQGAYLDRAHLQMADLDSVHLQGASLYGAHLQEAYFSSTNLKGTGSVRWSYGESFRDRILMQIGKETDLSGVTFAGGLTKGVVDSLVEGLSDEKANELRERLEPHIDQSESNALPEDSGAITGAYTEEDAEKWISEYEKVMSEVS